MRDACYNIPLLPSNLRQEETVKQLTDTLKYIENVSDDIFQKVNNQVHAQSKKLEDINTRLEVAKRKIEHIKGSNKAIQVFSSSKYPADDELLSYNTIFKDVDSALKEVVASYKKVHSKHTTLSESQIREKTQFFLVPRNRSQSNADQNEGLGGLPSNINAISSLLLFNSSENPYKKYSIFDPLGATTKTKTGIDEQAQENGLGDAPMSISNREQMDRPTAENYFYIPDLGDVPEIDVPTDLPDLPGIADLTFTSQLNDGIAPSLMAMSSLPDLPEVANQAVSTETNGPPPPPVNNNVPPPPPPPVTSTAPPPPPPPPVAPPPPPTDKQAPKEVTQPDSGRANLLASIRAVGGSSKAKLKSSKERKLEKKKAKEEAKATESSGGDLMSDLFSKLAMRRKGISGSKAGASSGGNSSESTGGGSAMDKISAMIPPPSQNHSNNNDADNGEWE